MKKLIREFGPALASWETYDLRRNPFALIGLLWGLPVPIMALGLNVYLNGDWISVENVTKLFREHPIHFFFLGHPLLFMVLFGGIGTLRRRSDQKIKELVKFLQKHLDELNEANKQLRELDKLKNEFLANVTHELRTPLVTIRGYTEMFLNHRMGELTEKQERSLGIMHRNVQRLLDLIGDILTLSRIGRRKVLKERRPFLLAGLLDHVISDFRPSAEKHAIRLNLDIHDRSIEILGLRNRIEQVFANLVSNSIKFTGGGGSIRVSTREQSPERISVEVKDSGCGIPAENLPTIFDRFVQADGSTRRRHGGAGLGLAIVRDILEAHDCSIRVSSEAGKGTRFSFELPLSVTETPFPDDLS